MSAGRGVDWRRPLIYVHRWMGIAGSLLFLAWFVSGVVMMYARMPSWTAEERLARLPPLDLSRAIVEPSDAARAAALTPSRIRISMLGDRPVYRFYSEGYWTTVFADSGDVLESMSVYRALQVVGALVPERARSLHSLGRLTRPDQWTMDGGLPRLLPMQRVSLGDEADTVLYVSGRTGDVVMKTTTRGKFWGYAGAVTHWLYFPWLRQQAGLWRYGIIYAAFAGCILCLSGLIVGIWRFSPRQRFRLKRVPSRSPYAGLMRWHHYAGLIFGACAFTWALSGALSLTPWDWVPSTGPTVEQEQMLSGGPIDLEQVTVERLRRAAASIAREFPAKELEVLPYRGRAFAKAFEPPSLDTARAASSPSVAASLSSQPPFPQRMVWLDDADAAPFERLDRAVLEQAARDVMPGVPIAELAWLDAYDAYYYDRWRLQPLPVLRARYADASSTTLYLDPHDGGIALRHTPLSRLNRWLYNGLHSFDLPGLYQRRPLWDIVVLALSVGGIVLTVTTMLPGWRRVRRQARAVFRDP